MSFLYIFLFPEKPIEEWTGEEVQHWFKSGDFKKFAPNFANLNGRALSELSKEDLDRKFDLASIAIFNAIQQLKGSTTSG